MFMCTQWNLFQPQARSFPQIHKPLGQATRWLCFVWRNPEPQVFLVSLAMYAIEMLDNTHNDPQVQAHRVPGSLHDTN